MRPYRMNSGIAYRQMAPAAVNSNVNTNTLGRSIIWLIRSPMEKVTAVQKMSVISASVAFTCVFGVVAICFPKMLRMSYD